MKADGTGNSVGYLQKQPSRGVLKEKRPENMQ